MPNESTGDRHSGALLTDAIRDAIGSDVDLDLVCRVCGAVGGHIEPYIEPDGALILICVEPRTDTRNERDRGNLVVGFVDRQVQRTLCGGVVAVVRQRPPEPGEMIAATIEFRAPPEASE